MEEWINPKYADVVASVRFAEATLREHYGAPIRGFITSEQGEAPEE
ncbi:hypothetical protein [Streptomyces sp. NPDC007100]